MEYCSMSTNANIVHITPTPLVGAPAKIAKAQRETGSNSIVITMNDYPASGALYRLFTSECILFNSSTKDFISELILGADIIHIHNFLHPTHILFLKRLQPTGRFIYQVHSPLREGPLYHLRAEDMGFNFHKKLVVGQYHPRIYQDYLPVPNIVFKKASITPSHEDPPPKLLFSPTHKHPGRWSNKYSEGLLEDLSLLQKNKNIELIQPKEALNPYTLLELRSTTQISIDEISTGAFHQVSIEALLCGNVVVNKADYFSKLFFSQFCDGQLPPFFCSTPNTIYEQLKELTDNPNTLLQYQNTSYRFAKKYLEPARLINFYHSAYWG